MRNKIPNDKFETINCPVCGSNNQKFFFDIRYGKLKQKRSLDYSFLGITKETRLYVKQCIQCKFVFVNPRVKPQYESLIYNESKEKMYINREYLKYPHSNEFNNKTRAGAIVRAGMDDKEMTIALGVNYTFISTAVFVFGAFVGGFSGFIGLPIFAVHPGSVFPILLLSLIVIVVGGVGRTEGVLLGAVIIGLIDSLGKVYFPDFAYFTMYVAMILILLIKPSGLLGRRL